MKLAIVIGHSAKSQGAVLYNGMTEWSFHQELIHNHLQGMLPGVVSEFQVFWRSSDMHYEAAIRDLTTRVNNWNAEFVIELHVNAYDGITVVKGCEYLHRKTDYKGFALGEIWQRKVSNLLKIQKRAPRAEGRGLYNIEKYMCPAVLLEPCFGDVEHRESRAVIGDPAKYAQILVECLKEYQKK